MQSIELCNGVCRDIPGTVPGIPGAIIVCGLISRHPQVGAHKCQLLMPVTASQGISREAYMLLREAND